MEYIKEVEKYLESKDIDQIKTILSEGAIAGSERCRLIIVYSDKEKWKDRINYIRKNIEKLDANINVNQFKYSLCIASTYIQECCNALNISEKYLTYEMLIEWLLIDKFNIKKSKFDEFWNEMEKDIYINHVIKCINGVKELNM